MNGTRHEPASAGSFFSRARIVYDEDRVVVVDKDAGVSSEDVAEAFGRRLVHRIDKATSGLLVLADDARTVQRLQRQLQHGGVERVYVFVAHGVVVAGVFASLLVRDRGDGLRGTVLGSEASEGAKHARLEVLDCQVAHRDGHAFSRGFARLVTGRTHQIRIQLAEAGHVLVGESVYVRDARRDGLVLAAAPRLLLHASRLAFAHPNHRRGVVVTSPPPADFVDVAAGLGFAGGAVFGADVADVADVTRGG